MKSKTIILSSLNSHDPRAGRGILTLSESGNNELNCKLRLYNISSLPIDCKLGMYYNSEVFKTNLINKGSCYEAIFHGNFDVQQDFYFAIVNPKNDVEIAGGTYAGCFFEDNSIFNEPKSEDSISEAENRTQDFESYPTYDFQTPTKKQTTETSDDQTECNKCEHCKYKEFFYNDTSDPQEENASLKSSLNESFKGIVTSTNNSNRMLNENDSTESSTQNNTSNIFAQILPQFDYIFENYTQNEELNGLIENSKFVKVEEENESYSLGAIYKAGDMKYICYAVKSSYNAPLPTELGKYHQWLPLDAEDPLSDGYHLVFQDAHDLKIIEV